MGNVYDRRNLVESKSRLVNFITKAVSDAPTMAIRLTKRVAMLGSVQKVADEMVRILLEESSDNQYEFQIDKADLMLQLKIDDSGLIKARVTDVRETGKAVLLLTEIIMDCGLGD